MLEGLAAWVLNNYLGKYVENLNTDQLSIALLSGEVELENLPIRRDALRHLGLPITLNAGFIGKVKLQIPVRQIKSAPWVIHIEQLYVVASPLPVQEWDPVAEELAAQELKLSALDNLEAKWRVEIENKEPQSTYYASTYSSWLNYGTGLITNIIENLQLKIKDVHIRYEDSTSIPDKTAVFGITIETLSAQSCNDSWVPGFSQWDSTGASFKLLELQKLAMYWVDLAADKVFSKMGLGELAVAMSPGQYQRHTQYYILSPVSAQARIRRNREEKPLRSVEMPRITCDLQLDEVPMTLVDWQYEQMVICSRGLDDVSRLRSYRFYRPSLPVSEDPHGWWFYAISCLYPGGQPNICRPPPTWETCLQRARENVAYVNLYKRILVTPSITLTPDEKKIKDNVEWSRDFNDLKILRDLAMKSVSLPKDVSSNASTGRGVLVRWFPQWMGWYSSESLPSNDATPLEGEILQALSDTVENNSLLKRDVIFGKFSFLLKSGLVTLCTTREDSEERVPMIELEFKSLSLNITMKPRSASHIVELSLGAMYLKDKITMHTLFPTLVGPPGQERSSVIRSRGPSPRVSVVSKQEDLFTLFYEKCPPNSGCDYRLSVKSKSLDVVYQPLAMKWLLEFLFTPHQRMITHSSIEAMKTRTKKGLIKNWEQILDGRASTRKIWDLQLDISAPQIFFIEKFSDQNSSMAVVDFGRFLLNNKSHDILIDVTNREMIAKESEEDEMFVTPCSTPPVSEEEEDLDPYNNCNVTQTNGMLNESQLHDRIYERYNVELTDMQILIGKVKDNWRYAHNKGTSTMHVLDRFNISLQIERRVVHTLDPSYPSLTLNANLPKLVAHFNEQKIAAARTLAQIITATGLPSPFNAPENISDDFVVDVREDEETDSVDTSLEMSRLLMMQFTIDHMALEVQSRGRSVAELQVSGVKVAFTKRPVDISITLTVHGLLLVDALQTFGPDFELLVASHKHVGMDSMSGSLRDSEPTSPTSPGSPDPNILRPQATSPVALSQALSSLAASPPRNSFHVPYHRPSMLDAEALISIEVTLITGLDPMQFANIQFNNLDIIANQETIVELMGFIRRVFPDMKPQKQPMHFPPTVASSFHNSTESILEETSKIGKTELTFDFHRLNVLLLRGVFKDGSVHGKKICTATMSEAKIQATVDNGIVIEGSLGGLQVLDLTPEGHMHQRIISVGRDPILDIMHPMYIMSQSVTDEDRKAFSFLVSRSLNSSGENDRAEITVRMASLWYTHSPQFVVELQSCATEFKQYLSNLARSIRSAATDMALGLVHARTQALAQSIYMNPRLSASIYGSALSFSDIASPRKRRRSSSMEQSFSGYSSVRDTMPQTPYSPDEDSEFVINIKLDVVLDSPVVVLPRSSNSPQVFVAHLGKITLTNGMPTDVQNDDLQDIRVENYDIQVRDMNIFSLDTTIRRVPGPLMSRPEIIYSCETLAKPMLHDTVLKLNIIREVIRTKSSRQQSVSNLLLDDEDMNEEQDAKGTSENLQVTGSIVSALKLSMARYQYEQLIDTISWLLSAQLTEENTDTTDSVSRPSTTLADIHEEDTGVTTLKMDPHVRAKLFPGVGLPRNLPIENKKTLAMKVSFELPTFIIELRGETPTGEQGLVDLSFREFVFKFEKCHMYETSIQVSLRSILMEDLLQPDGAKQRSMVVSIAGDEMPIGSSCISRSCPDISDNLYILNPGRGSLPVDLEPANVFGIGRHSTTNLNSFKNDEYPSTPPPSPSIRSRPQRNLVLISTLLVDPNAPNFKSYYNSVQRSTSVDFNCLDLVVSVESWVLVIDFFSASAASPSMSNIVERQASQDINKFIADHCAETNISVRSLTVVLVRPDHDIARANISHLDFSIKNIGLRKEIEGKLGSVSLFDLTSHGHMYRERFLTSGKQVLTFNYISYAPSEIQQYDSQLKLEMTSILYVHTKRFVAEINAFLNHFTKLQAVMAGIRAATSGQKMTDETSRLSLIIEAASPVILLPVSSKSADLLICDLGQLTINNRFMLSNDVGCISVVEDPLKGKCLLNVMYVELQNVNLYTGKREMDCSTPKEKQNVSSDTFKLGSCVVMKNGASLLTEACHFKLQVETNLDPICHNVPDMSIHGELSTLDGSLNEYQYKLIRGLLAYNLAENTEDILPSVQPPPVTTEIHINEIWKINSLRLDLLNVNIRLSNQCPLACINFIKSRLIIETFSNLSQDIDLVSQEILIRDTRFEDAPANKRSNVFTNILQPIKTLKHDIVQVEVHSRKRLEKTKSTILLNNMRLMAVFDWWESAREFIFQDIRDIAGTPSHEKASVVSDQKNEEDMNFEFTLNVTDSELIVVEDASLWDTNAVILKSTTVITYRPAVVEKPMSCNLNNCEMYSCILGMEDETALSIIDPVTLNVEVNKEKVLEVHLQRLTVRLSYYDMRMFLQILNSLPKQMLSDKKRIDDPPANIQTELRKLTALGFTIEDCIYALEHCDQKLDDSALWLTQYAKPIADNQLEAIEQTEKGSAISAVEVKADYISLCIIDDCGDADVPLLELSLQRLNLRQSLTSVVNELGEAVSQGAMECNLAGDYYNRVLSGWEPIVEPWKCLLVWNRSLSPNVSNHVQMQVESTETLNVNVTSTLTDLYRQVKENWTQDFYNNKDPHGHNSKAISSPPGYRRRSPFIPFAIKNDTGSNLMFTTVITYMEELYDCRDLTKTEDKWMTVANGETLPFTFSSRGKIRHSDSHKMRMHRLGVQVEGYQPVVPVTVDKVGVYFRNAAPSIQNRIHSDMPSARIVFDIAIEGSARKLITVRSALLIANKMKEDMEVKLENNLPSDILASQWTASRLLIIKSGQSIPVPLIHAHSSITARPIITQMCTFSSPNIFWEEANKPHDLLYELRSCHSPKGKVYRFCAEIRRENYPLDRPSAVTGTSGRSVQPGHVVTLLPTVLIVNLLPIDITFKITGGTGRVRSGNQTPITFVDTEDVIELNLYLDNFPNSNPLIIPPNCQGGTYRMKLEDSLRRKLNLTVVVTSFSDARLKILISVPYWIINKTGLPLVFRQDGASAESAGQFREHESARMVQPLLFSFSDPDASPSVGCRVGTNVISDGTPQWSSKFHLQKGCQVRKLRVSHKDGRSDTVFIIGIEIRIGRGRYNNTSIVIISPRFQLFNKTSYQLLFAQNFEAVNASDPRLSNPLRSHLKAMPDCHMPFHWTRFDQEQLLCVQILDIPNCSWSGGLKIDINDSLHVNIRDMNGRMYFLRLEVVLHGATFFAIFTDADTMPPPMRIDNFSEVSIAFAQACCKDIVHSIARAHSSIPYAWDKPRESPTITLEAPGGVTHNYNMNNLGPAASLTYENFIYIAFTGTFKRNNGAVDPLDVESQELVLDVVHKTEVVLARKQPGQRSQLWRMTSTGQLQHEGSSPPSHPLQPKSDIIYVLDIEGPAPQPSSYTRLCLRRPDPRRKSTQTWRFTEEGRLCCVHNNMCVQAQDGFFGLRQGSPVACWRQWNSAVLGLPQPICHRTMDNGVPLEQAVSRQRMRPGSGYLEVEITTDGPTKVLSIWDKKDQSNKFALSDDGDWSSIDPKQRPHLLKPYEESEKKEVKEFQLTVKLAGLGVSLVSRTPPEELLYAKLSNIIGEVVLSDTRKRFCTSVGDIQIDNQLLDAATPVVLHVTRSNGRSSGELNTQVLTISAEMLPILNEKAVIFKHLIVQMNKLTVYLEERILLKLFTFVGFNYKEEDLHNIDETDYETQKMLTDVSASHSKRYYFETIQLIPKQIRLSMRTANKLPKELQTVKRKLGLTFIKFEDAAVDMEAFKRHHSFETLQFLMNSIMKHFKDELKWQAAIILGSVDFLGNPIGLVSDVSEGVNGLIREGNVGALVTNIAHGLSNSAAKVTESISDGLGLMTMDEEHEEMRQRIRQVDSGRSRDHLYAGFKGLGFGVLGGATGIFKQVYEGAVNDGVQGVFSGFGKGLLGAVTKPVVGVLDLASETARAVRDSSRGTSRMTPDRCRPPRCTIGIGGLLPRYIYKQALGQQYLYNLNDRNYSEQLVAYDNLLPGADDLHVIISTQRVRIVTNLRDGEIRTVIEWPLSGLKECRTLKEDGNKHYIEIMMHLTGASSDLVYKDPVKKPKVRCVSSELASVVSQQINYAKRLFDERLYTVHVDNITNFED